MCDRFLCDEATSFTNRDECVLRVGADDEGFCEGALRETRLIPGVEKPGGEGRMRRLRGAARAEP